MVQSRVTLSTPRQDAIDGHLTRRICAFSRTYLIVSANISGWLGSRKCHPESRLSEPRPFCAGHTGHAACVLVEGLRHVHGAQVVRVVPGAAAGHGAPHELLPEGAEAAVLAGLAIVMPSGVSADSGIDGISALRRPERAATRSVGRGEPRRSRAIARRSG